MPKSPTFRVPKFFALLLILAVTQAPAAQGAHGDLAPLLTGIGDYEYPVSDCSGDAQQFFNQGLRLFYGFRFPESLTSFREASRLDSDCAMAHWGEALAIAPNPNSRYLRFPDDPVGAGATAIKRAKDLAHRASIKERRLIDALYALYDQRAQTDSAQRDLNYIEALSTLSKDYPDDPEVRTVYAQALMTKSAWDYWTPDGKARPGTVDALTSLESVLRRLPNHPGANHLFIHLLEDSQTPETALPHAERLASTMPLVGHMVHMPSHIYIRTGLYKKAIEVNEQSIKAAHAHISAWGAREIPMGVASLSSSDKGHDGHAIDFIHMAAVLQGNYSTAMEVSQQIQTMATPHLAIFGGMQRRYVTPMLTLRRFADWTTILQLPSPDTSYPFVQGIWHFVRGSALASTGSLEDASAELSALSAIATRGDLAELLVWVNPADTVLSIAVQLLSAEIAARRDELATAMNHLEAAVRIEDGLNYMEPPTWGDPARHELGALLMMHGHAAQAETVFWEDLRRNPENGWALHGVWQSLLAQGKNARAAEVELRFQKAWADADTTLRNSRATAR